MLMRTLGCVCMFTKSFSQLLLGHYNGTEKLAIPQNLCQPKFSEPRSFSSFLATARADACGKTCLSSSAHRARPWRPLRAPLALPRVVRLVRTSSQHCIIRSCRRSTPTSCYRPFFRTSFSYRQQHPIRINHCAPRSAFAPGSSSSHRNLQSYPGAKAAASNREMICRPSLPPLLHPHARRSCSSFASRSSPRRS